MEDNVAGVNETITLIREENRIDVRKEALANKSRYFSSLFSHNFNDSREPEHAINYDIPFFTLQSFVEWVHDEEERVENDCHLIKVSMIKFVKEHFADLLNLLQLSVLFMADGLIEETIDIIVLHWLLPDKIIDIWLLAQELSLNILRDICFSVCLDRFEELPLASLVELSKDNIAQLLGNINIRASNEYLHYVQKEWKQYHMTSDNIGVVKERNPKFVECFVVHKTNESASRVAYVYTWDGTTLSELVQLKDVKNSGREVIGMQVTGRGFSVYMVGGELGLGTGQFNKVIWRYCLISKKWYYQARMPVPRRHMVAVFIRNKLMIVGGVGRHRLKLSSVDILDIHTGKWTKAARAPEDFTEVPPHCVFNGKLFLIKSYLYIYHPDSNHWESILIYHNPSIRKIDTILAYDAALFLTGNHLGETVLSRIETTRDATCEKESCLKSRGEHSLLSNVNIVHEDETCQLKFAQVSGIGILLIGIARDSTKYSYLHLYTEIRRDLQESSLNPRLGYFDIIQPENLYDSF